MMRAKMKVQKVERFHGQDTVHMNPVCKTGGYDDGGLDEDNTFAKFSPSGNLSLTIANPALVGKITPGQTFYVDFTLVE